MMAAYAFEQPWDKANNANPVCKIAEDVKKKIESEERDCQRNGTQALKKNVRDPIFKRGKSQ